MQNSHIYQHLLNITQNIIFFEQTTERLLSNYFRKYNNLGKRDRFFISEIIYTLLRNKERILGFLTQNYSASVEQQIKIATVLAFPPNNNSSDTELLTHFLSYVKYSTRINEQAELPAWIIDLLHCQLNDEQIIALGQSLCANAHLDLRTNILKIKRSELIKRLQKDKILGKETPYSPWGIRIEGNPSLINHPLYQQGLFEIQDEGSQLIIYLSPIKKKQIVIDFCAGTGGKTLAIGAVLSNQGSIYALEISPSRLTQLKLRLQKSGLKNVYPILIENEFDDKLLKFHNKADIVLVDTPCSGLGTIKRQPDLKYRSSPLELTKLNFKQRSIINEAAKLCAKNGQLIYATCSILPQENEMIIQDFLKNHPDYTAIDCHKLLPGITIDEKILGINLNPAITQTDGFYLAILKNKGHDECNKIQSNKKLIEL